MSDTSAWRSPVAWITLLLVTALGLASDLATKHIAFARIADAPVHIDRADVLALEPAEIGSLLPQHDPVVAIPSVLNFTLVLNPGAVFGLGAGKRWFFVLFTGGAIALCLWMFGTWTRPRDRWAHAAIGLVLAGGLGNLYDRLNFACVRDFIDPLPGVKMPFGLAWPGGENELWPWVSNVADAYLIVGIAILLWLSFRPSPHERPEELTPSEPSQTPAP